MSQEHRKYLIINADDLGFSREVNDGIFRSHSEGILSSATLAANMPFAREAADRAKQYPNLGIGIHLNVVRGFPVSNKKDIRDLLDGEGKFFLKNRKLFRLQVEQPPKVLDQIEREYRAQIEKALSWGISPDHLDSERHHAAWPCLFEIMCRLAVEYKIGAVRLTNEPYWQGPKSSFKKLCQSIALRTLSISDKKIAAKYSTAHPKYFYGGTHIGQASPEFFKCLAGAVKEGVSELMTHPGMPCTDDTPEEAKSYLDSSREKEMQALTSKEITKALKNAGIEIVNFSHFKK